MLDFLKVIRYMVFIVFIISNTVVTSVAVWNLTIVQGSMRFSAAATSTASYLIAVATLGLLLVFPIVFLEITGKRTFLGVIWFELTWAGLIGMMTLVGASLITSLSSRELCLSPPTVTDRVVSRPILVSPCTSAQVLGVFTWMPSTFLLAYMTLLSILVFVQSKEDPKIWKSYVRDLPVDKILGGVRRNSISVRNSIMASLPHIRKTPVIYAPRPRHIIPPLLDCRSSRNSAYDFNPPLLPKSVPVRENSRYQPSVRPTAFYNSSVRNVIESSDGSRIPSIPRPVQSGHGRREQTSPPPLGDWPRLDATSRPRTKRSRSNNQQESSSPRRNAQPLTTPIPFVERHRTQEPSTVHRDSPRRTPTSLTTPVPFIGRPSVPPPRPPRPGTKPPGSGHSSSISGSSSPHRPPPLDLSRISTHLSRSERSRARAGQ